MYMKSTRPYFIATSIAICLCCLPSASAAFYLRDDEVPTVVAKELAVLRTETGYQPTPSTNTYDIPFLKGKSQLGPVGRQAIQAAIQGCGKGASVTVTTTSDTNKQDAMASRRAGTIKSMLNKGGVAASRIKLAYSDTIREGDIHNTVMAQIMVEATTPSAGVSRLPAPARALPVPDTATTAAIAGIAALLQGRQIDVHTATAMLMAVGAGGQPPLTQQSSPQSPPAGNTYRSIRMTGTRLPMETLAKGQGLQVSLLDAVVSIAPSSIRVIPQDIVQEARQRLSWLGGRPWLDVLDDVLARSGVVAEYNTDRGELSLLSSSRATTSSVPTQTWSVNPAITKSARQTLALWAEQAGWTVDWSALGEDKDYELAYPGAFKGQFIEAVAAFAASLDDPKSSGVEPIFYGNHIVRIVPKGAKK